MDLETKDLIKILPFDKETKKLLLENFDSLDAGQLFAIERILWDTYDALFTLKVEEKMQERLLDVKEGKAHMNGDLYNEVREEVKKEMMNESVEVKEDIDLSAARTAMEKIIKEIKASKKITLPKPDEI